MYDAFVRKGPPLLGLHCLAWVSGTYLMSAGAFKLALSKLRPQRKTKRIRVSVREARSWKESSTLQETAEIPHLGSLPSGAFEAGTLEGTGRLGLCVTSVDPWAWKLPSGSARQSSARLGVWGAFAIFVSARQFWSVFVIFVQPMPAPCKNKHIWSSVIFCHLLSSFVPFRRCFVKPMPAPCKNKHFWSFVFFVALRPFSLFFVNNALF